MIEEVFFCRLKPWLLPGRCLKFGADLGRDEHNPWRKRKRVVVVAGGGGSGITAKEKAMRKAPENCHQNVSRIIFTRTACRTWCHTPVRHKDIRVC